MIRTLLILLTLSLSASPLLAQQRFTQRLQQATGSQGQVVLYQSQRIADLVDGLSSIAPARQSATTAPLRNADDLKQTTQDSDSILPPGVLALGRRVRMNGYRIQVYAGGNNRESKMRAEQMENRVSIYYPGMSTYTRFVSPRWICHLGDFTSREEAMQVLNELRSKGGFSEAIIVKCKVNAWVQQ